MRRKLWHPVEACLAFPTLATLHPLRLAGLQFVSGKPTIEADGRLWFAAIVVIGILGSCVQYDVAAPTACLNEHTENDSYWGDGGDGSGKNMLGRILMEVRAALAGEEP